MPSSEKPFAPLGHVGLPTGLPDHVYASWAAALLQLHDSRHSNQGEERFQFCCGYIQALQDTQAVESHVCRFLQVQIQEIWLEISWSLKARGF